MVFHRRLMFRLLLRNQFLQVVLIELCLDFRVCEVEFVGSGEFELFLTIFLRTVLFDTVNLEKLFLTETLSEN